MSTIDLSNGELFRNAIRWEQTGEGVVVHRFTERQMELYARQKNYQIRSGCPAGICLDFVSDTASVELGYTVGEAARKWIVFDVFIDGVLIASQGAPSLEEDEGKLTLEYGHQNDAVKHRRWTVYLPQIANLTLRSLTLSEGAVVEAAKPYDRNLLCIGDSITQGMDARKPSSTYPVLLSRALEMNLLNHGVGGYVFDADSLDEELPYKPDLITVAYGTNDWGRYQTMEAFREQCARFFAKANKLYSDIPMYVLTPFWRADQIQSRPLGSLEALSDTIRNVCAAYPNTRLVDGQRLIPNMTSLFGDAYLHPNDEGFLHIAMNLYKRIMTDRV
ncbi:SGNH/GDSL hydrolase family protein [Paenibacillus sp. H1-7]|uniref:SGNH/GDSL hydrolase family protein n=1 Tax=Paenibacillus sp. H1-7 TaxID=2282849 RepID=UPI001EF8D8DA|nr:SGNH/GDSL hydrolase family protein [Paenibacillus sp. H1-7]ULL19181.1 SGNH/GDSL hydrolase family protein [Paenibacillus sp. H1-7]